MKPQPLFNLQTIQRLLPQRPPMLMVDALTEISENSAITRLFVTAGNLFLCNNCLSESGIVEHIAQSAAVRTGYLALQQGKEPATGLLCSIDRLSIFSLPDVGDSIETALTVLQEIENITLVEATSTVGERTIAHGKMKIMTET
jgi:predicted hotdog family 3-hydroxylacyl-ACP dehydratase